MAKVTVFSTEGLARSQALRFHNSLNDFSEVFGLSSQVNPYNTPAAGKLPKML